jgi:hypothetical protein
MLIIFLDPFSAGTLDFQYLFLSFPLSWGHGLRPEGPEWWQDFKPILGGGRHRKMGVSIA